MRNFCLASVFALACVVSVPASAQERPAVARHLFEAARDSAKALAELTPGTSTNNSVHIYPTVERAAALKTALVAGGPLVYHAGGRIMPTVNIYVIFWLPPKLQSGAPTTLSKAYQDLQIRLMKDYPGHGLANNNTQYFETVGSATNYILNSGRFVESYIDTAPYPASACKDTVTPGNCITDDQIKKEIQRVMALKNWKGGLNNIYFIYTGVGEGSCFDATSTSCAYTAYCAYHGAIPGAAPVIYANMPYADTKYCQIANNPSPNNTPDGDAAASVASHELTEAITDPLLNAWYSSTGAEIGDLCAWIFDPNTWAGNKANQSWNANFYELQLEYDNHSTSCVQTGPWTQNKPAP